ncbi:MAG: DUF962 domain-containing protein [Kangiellaceae bacterium]|nr:DUF962 domain-containing protein [Kangiellaceae bacterium]
MAEKRFETFQEFWPFYLGEHRLPSNRLLHYLGTVLSLVLLIYFIVNNMWLWLLLVPVAGYGFAWFGHFVIEKNRPATFSYPLWSLRGDYKMFFMALTGQLKKEWPKYF